MPSFAGHKSKTTIYMKHLFIKFEDGKIACSCVPDEYKLCPKRLSSTFDCVEAMVSVMPVERSAHEKKHLVPSVKSFDAELDNVEDALKGLNKYMDDFTKKG